MFCVFIYCCDWNLIYFFFFFQAEDGIRDYKVTGVQTCALPGSATRRSRGRRAKGAEHEPVNPELRRYLNRLSSLLYQMAVWRQKKERGKAEHPSYRT